jgi:hypothetical protein
VTGGPPTADVPAWDLTAGAELPYGHRVETVQRTEWDPDRGGRSVRIRTTEPRVAVYDGDAAVPVVRR